LENTGGKRFKRQGKNTLFGKRSKLKQEGPKKKEITSGGGKKRSDANTHATRPQKRGRDSIDMISKKNEGGLKRKQHLGGGGKELLRNGEKGFGGKKHRLWGNTALRRRKAMSVTKRGKQQGRENLTKLFGKAKDTLIGD